VELHLAPELNLDSEQQAAIRELVAAGKLLALQTGEGHALYVPFGEGLALPLSFTYAGIGPPAWELVIQTNPLGDCRPRCVRLRLDAQQPDEFIQAETLRQIPFGALFEEALLFAAVELDLRGQPVGPSIGSRTTSLAKARKLQARIEREHRRKSRGVQKKGRVTDETLREVARIYRAGLAKAPSKPAEDVHKHFPYYSRSTTNRLIRMARDVGYLGDAPGRGVAGDIQRTRGEAPAGSKRPQYDIKRRGQPKEQPVDKSTTRGGRG
jgi:hypothetical protein